MRLRKQKTKQSCRLPKSAVSSHLARLPAPWPATSASSPSADAVRWLSTGRNTKIPRTSSPHHFRPLTWRSRHGFLAHPTELRRPFGRESQDPDATSVPFYLWLDTVYLIQVDLVTALLDAIQMRSAPLTIDIKAPSFECARVFILVFPCVCVCEREREIQLLCVSCVVNTNKGFLKPLQTEMSSFSLLIFCQFASLRSTW